MSRFFAGPSQADTFPPEWKDDASPIGLHRDCLDALVVDIAVLEHLLRKVTHNMHEWRPALQL